MNIHHITKKEADRLLRLNISFLKKHGYLDFSIRGTLKWTTSFGNESTIGIESHIDTDISSVRLTYAVTNQNGNKESFDYNVMLTSTDCTFGEKRFWFVCPLTVDGNRCNRRVGVLYKGNDYFGCRHCFNLTYRSRNINRHCNIFPAISFLNNYQKIQTLNEKIKRSYYNGLPTRNEKKLLKLYGKCLRYKPHKLTYMES